MTCACSLLINMYNKTVTISGPWRYDWCFKLFVVVLITCWKILYPTHWFDLPVISHIPMLTPVIQLYFRHQLLTSWDLFQMLLRISGITLVPMGRVVSELILDHRQVNLAKVKVNNQIWCHSLLTMVFKPGWKIISQPHQNLLHERNDPNLKKYYHYHYHYCYYHYQHYHYHSTYEY